LQRPFSPRTGSWRGGRRRGTRDWHHRDYELSRLKEEATNKAWTENDVRDIWALCAATVYADIVVTVRPPFSWSIRCVVAA